MNKAYKFRIYPNALQREQIEKTFGCTRYVYNYFLNRREEEYKDNKVTLNYFACCKELTDLKKNLTWLTEIETNALRNALRDLDSAYQNFYRQIKMGKHKGFPKFKSKKQKKQSYRSNCVNNSIRMHENHIQLPKLGKVKCKGSREVMGRILSATVTKNAAEHYYVSICCTDVNINPFEPTGNSVGLNMGIKHLVVSSNEDYFENPKFLSKNLNKLAALQRELSRKTKGSKRYEKARIKIARLHEHISNQRRDLLHKASYNIVKSNDIICVRDLDIKNMLKSRLLSKGIADAAWGEFLQFLKYKSEWYCKKFIKIDKHYPCSEICSNCGCQNDFKTSNTYKWTCSQCGTTLDRETNAAKNILNEGLRLIG